MAVLRGPRTGTRLGDRRTRSLLGSYASSLSSVPDSATGDLTGCFEAKSLAVNHQRVDRVYRSEGLMVRVKRGRR
jgi:hypothetical protein